MAVVPPPYNITEADKQGLIVVTTAITFSFTWSCFGIRLWLRCKSIESWKLDDFFLTGATVGAQAWDLREIPDLFRRCSTLRNQPLYSILSSLA